MAPAFLLPILYWRLSRKKAVARTPAVEPQTINSILGASEKWSIIPATYILVVEQGDAWLMMLAPSHEAPLFIP